MNTTTPAYENYIATSRCYPLTLDRLIANQSLSLSMAEFLKSSVKGRANIVIVGSSRAGKTTLLEGLTHYFDDEDSITVVEQYNHELVLPSPLAKYVYAERLPLDSTLGDRNNLVELTRSAAQTQPDRLILGDARGPEFLPLIQSAHSGKTNFLTTTHASRYTNPKAAQEKMTQLVLSGPVQDEYSANQLIADTVHLIVHVENITRNLSYRKGRNLVTCIEEVTGEIDDKGEIVIRTLFGHRLKASFFPLRPPSERLVNHLSSHGVTVDNNWFNRTS